MDEDVGENDEESATSLGEWMDWSILKVRRVFCSYFHTLRFASSLSPHSFAIVFVKGNTRSLSTLCLAAVDRLLKEEISVGCAFATALIDKF